MAHTNRSAFDGGDELLARAGWATALVDRRGRMLRVHCRTHGPHTPKRPFGMQRGESRW